MRSKNGTTTTTMTTTKMFLVFVIFLGASFTANSSTVDSTEASVPITLSAEDQTAATATGEVSVTNADSVTLSAADQSATTGAGVDSVTSEAQATDGAGQTQESVTVGAVTSNRDDGSQSTQGQTASGAELGASVASQGTAAEEATGVSTARAAPDGTTNNAGLEETTTAAEGIARSAEGTAIAADGTTAAAQSAAGTAEGTTTAAEETTADAVRGAFKEISTETSRVDVSIVSKSGRQTTETPERMSMKSCESEVDDVVKGSLTATTTTAPLLLQGASIGDVVVIFPPGAAVSAVLFLLIHSLCKKCREKAPSSPKKTPKERILLEEGSPGEPDVASNPISDAEIVGGEGPVPGAAAAATPNGGGGGQPISNPNDENSWVVPIEDVENTKL